MSSIRLGGVIAACAVCTMASAEEAGRCVRIEDEAARLACYDRAFGRESANKSAERAASSASPSKQTAASGESFGSEDLRKPTREEVSVESIRAKIERMQEGPSGSHTLWLDNGQVWRQTEPTDAVRFKAGDPIVVKRGALNSYRMHKEQGGRAVPVKRVQ